MGRENPASFSFLVVPGSVRLWGIAGFGVWANGEGDVLNDWGLLEEFGTFDPFSYFTRSPLRGEISELLTISWRDLWMMYIPPNVPLTFSCTYFTLLYPLRFYHLVYNPLYVRFDSLCDVLHHAFDTS